MAHLRVAYEPDDDDGEVATIPALPASPPQLLPLPSAWWETPAVTSRALSPAPEEARAARVFVRELLTCWGLDDLVDDAELIITELVVNAVRHGMGGAHLTDVSKSAVSKSARSPVRLCLLRRAGEVMLAVTDPSTEAPLPRPPNAVREYGRGLQIVGALSYVWGWSPIEGHGKAVWAVLKYAALSCAARAPPAVAPATRAFPASGMITCNTPGFTSRLAGEEDRSRDELS